MRVCGLGVVTGMLEYTKSALVLPALLATGSCDPTKPMGLGLVGLIGFGLGFSRAPEILYDVHLGSGF